ncbi:MAG: type IVB secretion system protein IcmH/DotU [Candidatus Sedimenticola sp. (ex Thyasira tokunagai)]
MNTDDPFFGADSDDSDRTVIRPSPGGRRPNGGAPPPPSNQPPPQRPAAAAGDYTIDRGLNPLVTAASPLLSLITKLRNTSTHRDVSSLRRHVEDEIGSFESRAATAESDRETIHAARYCLCTVLDETVLNTPWGNQSAWSGKSLLILFHQESWGGEKFFVILERMMKEPARHVDMLELMYICLSMGFEGKYRVLEGGLRTLEQVRETLFQTIRRQRGEFERDLSPHWRGEEGLRNTMRFYIPLWVVATLSCALLLATYLVFSYFINQSSTPVFKELYTIGREEPPEAVLAAAPPPPPLETGLYDRIAGFLEEEIRQGLVEVIDNPADVIVRLRNKGLFGSGSAQISSSFHPLLQRIADALTTVKGNIIVAGHSDNVPIHTVRFPSNWHLSMARAEAVTEFLKGNAAITQMITSDGRADNEPLVPNDTPKNRAKNRRVEIILEK